MALAIIVGAAAYSPPAHAMAVTIMGNPIELPKWIESIAKQAQMISNQVTMIKNQINQFTLTKLAGQAEIDTAEAVAEDAANQNAANTMALVAAGANEVTVAHTGEQQIAIGALTAQTSTELRAAAEAMCRDVTLNQAVEQGGAPNTGASVPRGRQQHVFQRLSARGAGAPRSSEVVDDAAAVIDDEAAAGGASATGSPSAQGGPTQYRDQALLHLDRYVSAQDSLGAAGAANIQDNPNTAWLDTRAGDLLTRSGTGLNLLCFAEEATGEGDVLGGFATSFCPPQTWEQYYVDGEGRNLPKRIDLSTAFVIRDYLVPAGLTPFKPNVYRAARNNDAKAQEAIAKRQAYLNMRNIVFSVFNRAVADRAPQKMSDEDYVGFNQYWKWVYGPEAEAPRNASLKLRQDTRQRYFSTSEYISSIGADSGRATAKAAGVSVGLQKDILYTLERIEMLLTIQLANDLNDRRSAVDASISAANNAR